MYNRLKTASLIEQKKLTLSTKTKENKRQCFDTLKKQTSLLVSPKGMYYTIFQS